MFCLSGALFSQTTLPEWRLTSSLPSGLYGHKSVMLPDGNILIAGGIDNNGNSVNTCLIYNYGTGIINPVEPLTESRGFHSLICIPEGKTKAKIYLIGGYSGNINNFKTISSIEMLDYTSGMTFFNWRKIGDMRSSRAQLASVWDKGNYIVISGGFSQATGGIASGSRLSSSERINIASNVIEQLPDMTKKRANHLMGCIIDENGLNKIISAAGEDDKLTTTELLENWVWTSFAFSPKVYHDNSVAFSDIGGIGRIFGGEDNTAKATNKCEWYDVKSGWKYSPSMFVPRENTSATLIAGKNDTIPAYLIAGGRNQTNAILQTEYFSLPDQNNPAGLWVQFDNLKKSTYNSSLSIGGHNLPLYIGGLDNSGNPQSIVQAYQPLQINDVKFSPEEIGRISDSVAVPIRNSWLLPVKLTKFRFTNTAEFILTADTTNFIIQPNSTRLVYLRFRPNSAGKRQGSLLVNISGLEDTVKLEGTGIQSSIAVLVTDQKFGDVFINNDSTICFKAIQNNGTDTTYIDSLVVQPTSDYEVISPQGRVKIPPDSALSVCLRFKPHLRSEILGSMLIHIGTKSYPCGLSGKGIIKYLSGMSFTGCDTVNYESGKKYTTFITLRNISDRPVNVTGVQLLGGFNNLFSINQTFPFILNVQASKSLPVDFAPQSEGSFILNILVDNDGIKDSIVNLPICFVARSKNAAFSISSIDFGKLCLEDSVATTVFVENPSYFDNLSLDSLRSNDLSGNMILNGFNSRKLNPRENSQFVISLKSLKPGKINYIVSLYTSNGKTDLPVSATFLPTLNLNSQDTKYEFSPGQLFTVPLNINMTGFTNSITTTNFDISYDGYLVRPSRLIQLQGGLPLDLANSSLTTSKLGESSIKAVFTSPITSKPAIGIEFEMLLGNSSETEVKIAKSLTDEYCLNLSSFKVLINSICGGRKGLISVNNALVMLLTQDLNNDELNINIYSQAGSNIKLKIYDTQGNEILQENLIVRMGIANKNVTLTGLSSGLYFVVVLDDQGNIAKNKILLMK